MSKKLSVIALSLVLLVVASAPVLADSFNASESIIYPVDTIWQNDCTGELIAITGARHMVIRQSIDASGRWHYQFRETFQNLSGTGLSTGTNYRVAAVDQGGYNWDFSFTGGQLSVTNVEQVRFVAQGEGPDAVLKLFTHATVDANNVLRVDIEQVELICN